MSAKQTIFVVDDSPSVVKFVSFSLKNSGYKVLSASDGMEAVEKLSMLTDQVDLLITDLNMPNLDGYGLISTLRSNDKHRQLPIIVLSSEDREEERKRGMAAGATSFIVKPFKSSLLLNEVMKFLN